MKPSDKETNEGSGSPSTSSGSLEGSRAKSRDFFPTLHDQSATTAKNSPTGQTNKLRLQVFLSHSGQCSRRKAMDVIFKGNVSVNGRIVLEPSALIDPDKDRVCLNGQEIKIKTYKYIMLNKPRGYATTKFDPHADKTVLDLLPRNLAHLHPVGRLDKDTEGLLLLTNDGDLAYKITHPKFNVDKTYIVEIQGNLTRNQKKQLEKGIVLDNKKTYPSKITKVRFPGGKTIFCITIHEGRKRQIRRMLSSIGYQVLNLKRIKQGTLDLNNLPTGKYRSLTSKELASLKKDI